MIPLAIQQQKISSSLKDRREAGEAFTFAAAPSATTSLRANVGLWIAVEAIYRTQENKASLVDHSRKHVALEMASPSDLATSFGQCL